MVRFKRGAEATIPTFDIGEPGFTMDTEFLFVGSKDGNIKMAKQKDLDTTNSEVTGARGTYPLLGNRLDNTDTLLADSAKNKGINIKSPPAPFIGAKGDGATDDSGVINTLLNNYKHFYIPDGTYGISTPIVLPSSGIYIEGDSMPDPAWQTNPAGARFKALVAMDSMFKTTGSIQTVSMKRLFLDGNNLANRGISLNFLVNQMGEFDNLYIHNATNEQFYYHGNTGNFVVLRNSIVDGGTKGVVCDGADWLTVENVFASNQSQIPFHHISGTHCYFNNCHAYLTQNTVTACFQSDSNFNQGECHLHMPVIENHLYVGSNWSAPIAFNAPNQGVHTCYMWRNVTGGGITGITTVFSSNWSYQGLSQGWSNAENPNGSSTQYDLIHNGVRMWSALPFGTGISRGNIYGSPTSNVTLSQSGTNNPSGGARNGIWCRIPSSTLPAVGNTVVYPITTSALNNDVTQAIEIIKYSGFTVPNYLVRMEARPTSTGVTIYVVVDQYPASGTQDLVFLLLFGV